MPFFAFLGLLFVVFTLLLPWLLWSRVRNVQRDLSRLAARLAHLEAVGRSTSQTAAAPFLVPPVAASPTPEESPRPVPASTVATGIATPPPVKRAAPVSLESRFGGKFFVWLGGIALALAGLFLVKYSIENGLLTPATRSVLGGLLGLALLAGGDTVRRFPRLADGRRIAQALSGAGLAVLYGVLFISATLYALVPSFVGFAGMAAVTVTAVLLALRHGKPIAVLGLVGGLLTPVLTGHLTLIAPSLFIYLTLVFVGFLFFARQSSMPQIAGAALLGVMVWAGVWLFIGRPADSVWLCLFLFAVGLSASLLTPKPDEKPVADAIDWNQWIPRAAWLSSVVLMGFALPHGGFDPFLWGFFALLSAATIGLASFQPTTYRELPFLAMATVALLVVTAPSDASTHASVLAGFGLLFGGSGWWLRQRTNRPVLWDALFSATSILYLLTGYTTLRFSFPMTHDPLFWGLIALVLMAFCLFGRTPAARAASTGETDTLLALDASVATVLFSIAFSLVLDRLFLPIAFAAQAFGLSWIATRVEPTPVRRLAYLSSGLAALLILPDAMLAVQTLWSSLFLDSGLVFVDGTSLARPALMAGFLTASALLTPRTVAVEIRALQSGLIAVLIGLALLALTRLIVSGFDSSAPLALAFGASAIAGNLLLATGAAAATAERRWKGFFLDAVSGGFTAAGLWLLIGVLLISRNPLLTDVHVGSLPLINGLLFAFGLPLVTLRQLAVTTDVPARRTLFSVLMLVFGLSGLTFEVRHFFHGTRLDQGLTSSAEIYSYSAVWIVSAIGLLLAGVRQRNPLLRQASLVVMLGSIFKVFFLDAAALTGLWRVVSFLGLGVCLLGLSWFYSRFVFGDGKNGSGEKNGG
jgi:hypothetical protein